MASSLGAATSDGDAIPLLPRTGNMFPRHPLDRAVSRATLVTEEMEDTWDLYAHELRRLAALAFPLVASSLSSFLVPMVGVAFVGRLGTFELSVVVLSTSFFNVTGLSFIVGTLGALETLCGQAFGMKQYAAVGIALQRAMALTLLLSAGVALAWSQMESLMLLLGQEPKLAAASALYLHWTIPSLFFLALAECLKRYLMAQSIVLPATVAAVAASLFAFLFNYLLVVKAGLGLLGSAIASNIAQAAPLVVLLIWSVVRERKLHAAGAPERTWHGWSTHALSGWGTYLRLALPSAAMVCLEWWTFELCVLMSGWLADPELGVSVMGLTLNLSGLLYMLPLGVGSATSVRVGNALGAGLPHAARRAALAATSATLTMQVGMATGVILARNVAGYLFTSDPKVVNAAALLFPIMAICMLGDGLNATIGGMLRGAGRQELGAAFNLAAYWGIGLPLAGFLAFKAKMGVAGLWTGLATCASINGVVMAVCLSRMNWHKEAQRARGLVEKDFEGKDALQELASWSSTDQESLVFDEQPVAHRHPHSLDSIHSLA